VQGVSGAVPIVSHERILEDNIGCTVDEDACLSVLVCHHALDDRKLRRFPSREVGPDTVTVAVSHIILELVIAKRKVHGYHPLVLG